MSPKDKQTPFALRAEEEQWKQSYHTHRYLEHCNHAELTERMDDILVNLYRFTAEGMSVVPIPFEKNRWMRLLVDVIFEIECRQLRSVSFDLKNFHLDNQKYPNVIKATTLWASLGLKFGSCILKFGQLKYQKDLLEKGLLKVSNASSYKESFVPSIKDDELVVNQIVTNGRVVVTDKDNTPHEMESLGPCLITHSTQTDYYISSYTALFENRLFDDFSADSCLIIKNLNEFEIRLRAAMSSSFPNAICGVGRVDYFDPYFLKKDPDVFFTKHFRYQYQNELRFIWVPEIPQQTLRPIFLELGCLADICELITLSVEGVGRERIMEGMYMEFEAR